MIRRASTMKHASRMRTYCLCNSGSMIRRSSWSRYKRLDTCSPLYRGSSRWKNRHRLGCNTYSRHPSLSSCMVYNPTDRLQQIHPANSMCYRPRHLIATEKESIGDAVNACRMKNRDLKVDGFRGFLKDSVECVLNLILIYRTRGLKQ